MKGLKIAVSGAHSTGKTNFLTKVAERIRSKGISYSLVTDLAIRCPLPILRKHTVESTLWIVTTGIAEEIVAAYKADVVLVDRPILDAWAYLMAVLPNKSTVISTPQFKTLENTIRNWIHTYTLIYKARIDESIPIEDNKARDLDLSYRLEIEQQMELTYQMFGVQLKVLTAANALQEMEWLVNYLETNIKLR
ncbi:MAG: AAA family ATPase [Thermodesulfobacteriota bacterium]